MKILVTGSKGFIAKNLIAELKNKGYFDILELNRESSESEFLEYCKNADFIFHLAGVNRPENNSEFYEGNANFTEKLINTLKECNNYCSIVMTSSIQAELENDYGKSKLLAEETLIEYKKELGVNVRIYRLPNVFGKWCKPNYNSVIATFCHNVSRNIPIIVNNRDTLLNLVYIDDVVEELVRNITNTSKEVFDEVDLVYKRNLGEISDLIEEFKNSRTTKYLPNMEDDFVKKLYSTYLSYLPQDEFAYDLKMNVDNRGSFTEFIKTLGFGQVSVNVSKAGITKGNHWHHTKNEKFLVVSGKGVIRFRNIFSEEVIEYFVSGDKLQVVDIPVGYTHNIENLGDCDMVTIMWANETFDENRPDTFFMEI